ncbi:MAG: EF-hand domain-containing protein [Chloroflexi bacterium]|nr:EF-hand domain-containing protein [Chloroflexota bacterium]
MVESGFTLQDRNGDGKISSSEFIAYLRGYNVTEQDAKDAFARLDRNDNGFITKKEMMLNMEEYFMSEAPEAPGNWLFGSF